MTRPQHKPTHAAGFTLIELLIVITLIGILAAVAMPALTTWQSNSTMNADLRRLYAFFQRARLEAVKRNVECSILFNPIDGNPATPDYFVFTDQDGDNLFEPANGDVVLVNGALSAGVTMPGNNLPLNGGGLLTASFNPRGLIEGNNGANFIGATITLQSGAGQQHSIILNQHGRMRIQ